MWHGTQKHRLVHFRGTLYNEAQTELSFHETLKLVVFILLTMLKWNRETRTLIYVINAVAKLGSILSETDNKCHKMRVKIS